MSPHALDRICRGWRNFVVGGGAHVIKNSEWILARLLIQRRNTVYQTTFSDIRKSVYSSERLYLERSLDEE